MEKITKNLIKRFKKTTFFPYFKSSYKKVYYDKRNDFRYGDLNSAFSQVTVDFLLSDKCFSYVATKEVARMETLNLQSSNKLMFNSKGEYYIKYLEWEDETL